MTEYKFSYRQISGVYDNLTFGAVEPKKILVGPETFVQLKNWYNRNWIVIERDGALVYLINGAEVKEAKIAEGIMVFIGGAHIMKLERVDG